MPNANGPFGLLPYAHMDGAPYNGAMRTYYVPASNATALFVGDPLITLGGQSDANGVPAVGIAAAGAGNYIIGPMQGISNNAGQLTITVQRQGPVYLPAGQAAYIYVVDDPTILFSVQEDSVGGALPVAASSKNASMVAGAGNALTGTSAWALQSSSLNTTAQQLRIIQALQAPNNQAGAAYAKWLVKINQHQQLNPVGT